MSESSVTFGGQAPAQAPARVQVRVRYFASLREALGPGETVGMAGEGATVGALRDALLARGGRHAEALSRSRAVRAALDQRMVADEGAVLADGSEVAFFPPVTGG